MADSTFATISVAGMLVGVTAKFNPFSSNDTSASLRYQELGYLRSESTTADQPQTGPVREQHLIVGIIVRIEMHQ